MCNQKLTCRPSQFSLPHDTESERAKKKEKTLSIPAFYFAFSFYF